MFCIDPQLAGDEESCCPCEDYLSVTDKHRCWSDLGSHSI